MIRTVSASAPGKLMISGEYAVLDGAVAVVAAVDVRAYARWSTRPVGSPGQIAGSPQSLDSWREAKETRGLAEEATSAVLAELSIEADAFKKDNIKYGLGSSAAAAAAAAGAVLASNGENLSDPAVQRRAFDLAWAGHKRAQPQGSGADVAASALGGFVRFRLAGGQVADATRLSWPQQVLTRVVWTRKQARTSEFVQAVRNYQGRDASGFGAIRDSLIEQSSQFADAIQRADGPAIVAAAGKYGDTMGELGNRAGVSIVTHELAQIATLARHHGGSAKPSGAGGGDVAIAFFTNNDQALAFDAACREAELDVLNLGLGAPGVRPETP